MIRTVEIALLVDACCLGQAQQAPPLPRQTSPVPAAEDDSGYEQIFDGQTLKGWEGDPE